MGETDNMSDSKPLASLSSSLLARKGGAKPAMRRQGFSIPDPSHDQPEDAQEDLGWNDMGYDVNPDHSDHPIADEDAAIHYNPLAGAIPETIPAVKQQQEEIAAKLGAQSHREPEAVSHAIEAQPAPVPLSISREVAPIVEQSTTAEAVPVKQRDTKKSRPARKSRTRKAKAAFTLRLDPERHLRLRLATAVKNVSAQQLVTKAVDEYLRTIPELDDLAERIPSRGAS